MYSNSDVERILNKIEYVGECWIWQGAKSSSGYGNFFLQGKYLNTHKASYMLFKGEVPEGLQVMHSCDTKLCVNPAHLEAGTPLQNTQDSKIRGLVPPTPTGDKHHCTKISDAEVWQMRDLHKSGLFTYDQIAKLYNTVNRTVAGICRGVERSRAINPYLRGV
jgi:hypothetical protein